MKIDILTEQTSNSDLMLAANNGFPILYMGKGSYMNNATINSYSLFNPTSEVHLFYVGRYTSIARNLKVYFDYNHDYHSVYQGVIPEYKKEDADSLRIRMGQNYRYIPNKGMVIIGNDVWIGDDVSIIADCIIGDGAVIGAGSVVTHDIPPFTIWAGNPARKIKERFSTEIAQKLQSIQWWRLSGKALKTMEADMKGDVWSFVQKYFENAIDDQAKDRDYSMPIVLAFIDSQSDFSTFGNIVEEFISSFNNDRVRLRLAYYDDNSRDTKLVLTLSELLSESSVNNVDIVKTSNEYEEGIIKGADYMVVGRDIRFIDRISLAFKYKVKLISGVNHPVFSRKILEEIEKNI